MAGTGLIQLQWWDLPAWTLLALWPFTLYGIIACIIAALLTRNSRIPSALVDAWVALGIGLLILLALFTEVIVLPALLPTIPDKLFLAWGFAGLAYLAITAGALVIFYGQKLFKR